MRVVRDFFSNGKLKHSSYLQQLSSLNENVVLYSFEDLVLQFKSVQLLSFYTFFKDKKLREVLNCVIKDMLHLVCMWRQIRGYPQSGSTTHTNANTAKKNKLLLNYRLLQFEEMFGLVHRDMYVMLLKGEYNNRLYYYNWREDWIIAAWFSELSVRSVSAAMHFDPVLLAGNRVNGFPRRGRAATMSKHKKLVNVYTIGVPLLFSRFILLQSPPRLFPKIKLKIFNPKRKKRVRRVERKKK